MTTSFFIKLHLKCDIIFRLSLHSDIRKEVYSMENLISFLWTIMAEVAGYYICKWLDRL